MTEFLRVHLRTDYTVNIPEFSGPLDLLLQLIERQDLDITKLSLAKVTDQFLEYLDQLPHKLAEEVSAFLVIASKLIQIKSELLLPRPHLPLSEEEDIGEALAQQLRVYKQFKRAAEYLSLRQMNQMRTYARMSRQPYAEVRHSLGEITLEEIAAIAQEVFSRQPQSRTLGEVIQRHRVTIRDKIRLITDYLKTHPRGKFFSLFSKEHRRLDIAITFLALLELVRRRLIQTRQERLFEDIEFEAIAEVDLDQVEFELEFGE